MKRKFSDLTIAATIAPASSRWPSIESTHWNRLRACVDAARGLAETIDIECAAVEADADLSQEGRSRKRAKLAAKAMSEIHEFEPLVAAQKAVTHRQEQLQKQMTAIPAAPTTLAEVAMAEEIRAHISRQPSPVSYALNHANDARLVAALIHAPPWLAGLSQEQVNVVRLKAETALHPEITKERELLERALEDTRESLVATKRMILERTEMREDADGMLHPRSVLPAPGMTPAQVSKALPPAGAAA